MPDPVRARALVGRDDELGSAGRALAAVAGGRGSALLVTGEAGVGKTRVATEVADRARDLGLAVLTGAAADGAAPLRPLSSAVLDRWRGRPFPSTEALQPFRPALSRLVPGWLEPAAPAPVAAGPAVLAEGLLELLGRPAPGTSGTVVVLEDLHWADQETLAVVEHVAGALDRLAVLLVLTARSDEAPEAVRASLRRTGADRLVLDRLPDPAARELAADCVGEDPLPAEVLDAVVAQAEGLPLLVEELLTGLLHAGRLRHEDGVWALSGGLSVGPPRGLVDLVADRLARLPAQDRAVLRAAAVVGDAQDWRLLTGVAGVPEEAGPVALRSGVEVGLLARDGGTLRWRHALMREAMLAGLLPPEQEALAAQAAEVLDTSAGAAAGGIDRPGDAARGRRAAELWEQGGRPDRAAALLARLGRAAVSGGDLADAIGLLGRAAALGDPGAVAADRVRALTAAGRAAEALALGGDALAATSGTTHTALCLALARSAVQAARWDEALALVDRSGAAGTAEADALAADAHFGAGRLDRAARLAEAVATDEDAPPGPVCEACEVAGRCARASDVTAAAGWFRRGAQVAAAAGLVADQVRALHSLGTLELAVRAVSPALAEARRAAAGAGMLGTVASIDVIMGEARLAVEGPRASAETAAAAADLAGRLGMEQLHMVATVLHANAFAWSGDEPAARELLGGLPPEGGETELDGMRRCVLSARPLLAHDLRSACDVLDEGIGLMARTRAGAPVATWGLWCLLRAVLDDRAAEARAVLLASPAAVRSGNRAALAYAEAVERGRAGDEERAVALLAEGDALTATQPWWRRLLRLLVLEAAVADGWGDPVSGLRADLSGFEAGGDDALARTCRDLLRRAGVSVRRGRGSAAVPPALRSLGVTSREMDVLVLVADGLTNAEVAQRLVLSSRTVDHHVARLLARTGASNRAGLRAVLRDAGDNLHA